MAGVLRTLSLGSENFGLGSQNFGLGSHTLGRGGFVLKTIVSQVLKPFRRVLKPFGPKVSEPLPGVLRTLPLWSHCALKWVWHIGNAMQLPEK